MSAAGELLELTILMPCLNDAESIAACVRKARNYIESHGLQGEVLVADNGSGDGSQVLAQACGARVIQITSHGYGATLLGGIQAARGRYIVIGDPDDSNDFGALDPFMQKLREGYELVIGNRFLGGFQPHVMPPLHRYLPHPVLTGLGRWLMPYSGGDLYDGLRAFEREAILSLGLTSPGREFPSEMLVKASLRKLRVTEVPTLRSPDGRSRLTHRRSWRDQWRHLRFLLLFSPTSLFFYPGLLALLCGVAGMAWLVPRTADVAATPTWYLHALVFAGAAIVCGFQAVVFYMLTRSYAVRLGMLQNDRLVERMSRALRLEGGLITGLVCILAGMALVIGAFTPWGRQVLGSLGPGPSFRVAVPSATLLVLGLQIVCSSCLLGMLQLDTRTSYARTRRTDRARSSQPAGAGVPGTDGCIR
jgi:Glycosyl transferase family 2